MKKNNSYLFENTIDIKFFLKGLFREKILILSISIICGLLGYFYTLSKPQEFKSQITLKNPPTQIFDAYNLFNSSNNYNTNTNNNTNANSISIAGQFISEFNLNFLSSDNVENFIEENREFNNFKDYLKSRNISAREYFKIGEVKEKNIILTNKYFLIHSKEFDGAIFLNKYAEFIKKKTITELKSNLRLSLLNIINNHNEAIEIAKKIQLENPIIKTNQQQQVVTEPEALFYKGTKVLTENINYLNRRLIKLESDKLDYNVISQKSTTSPHNPISLPLYFASGLMLGFFLSLVIIFFKNILK